MALSDHTLIAAYPLGSGIEDLQDSYDGYSAQNMTFAGDGDLSGLPVADFNSSYYGIDNALQNGFDTEYSFSMWMKPDTIAHSWLMNNEQHGTYYATWGVVLQADGQLQLFARNANGGAYDIARTGVSLVVDEWSHVAATWSGTEIKWYVDGALVSTTAASRIPWNSPATLWIGANATKSGVQKYYFDGKMSDLRFWYSELTASDVAELHAAGQVPIDLGIVLHHDCDDATAEIGEDITFTDVSISSSSGRTHWDFANLNSKAVLSDPNNLPDMAGDWTVSMWFSEMTAPTTWRSIARSQTELLGVVSSPHHTPANTLGVYTTTAFVSAGYSMNYLDFQNWNHMVIVGSGTTTKFYINGSHVGTAPAKISSDLYALNNTFSGNHNQLFTDNMDDVRVWSRALSEGEISALHSSTIVTPSLTDDLVAKYALDTDATDSVGSANGTASGVTFSTSAGRSFADFGAGSYIDLGVSSGFDISGAGDFSVSAWINPDSLSLPFGQIAGSVVSGASSPANAGWQLVIHQGVLKFRVGGSGSHEDLDYTLPVDVAGSWNHVTATRDGTSVKLYLNGVEVASGTFASIYNTYTATAWHKMSIGGYYANSQWYTGYDGKIDDVRIWNRNLSALEVTTLHAAGAEASSGGASALIDITYGGQLSGVRAFDHNGSVFCYITEESEAPSVYFGTDLSDFASFEKKTIINELSQPMALDGKPISMSMKSDDGSIYLGTSSGKLYHVAYDAGTNCVAKELHDAAEGVRKVHWDSHRSECLFESDGVIHSVDSSETVSVKHALAAGSMVEDFKAAPAGVAIVFRKADFTFEVMFVEGTNWASPKASSQMIESVRAARDFEYNSDLDMWVAAGSTGQISVATLF